MDNATEQAAREIRLSRIHRLSSTMKWFVTVVFVLIAVLGSLLALVTLLPVMAGITASMLDLADVERKLSDVPLGQRVGLVATVCVAFFLLGGICWHARQLFDRFSNGAFFEPETQSRVVKIGAWLIAYGVFDILSNPISSVLLTWDRAPGQRQLEIALNGGEFLVLIFGALMLVFGWIMREAATLAEENRQFV
ncbi:DUF2975 domain-containing protein [Roseibium sp. MMSF_3544]|uniref:DUF2975 domain-containing protein n=1 Tax=unclassified Roseibium TaxID=2629323 RepID=UPI00273EE5F0|nr:DUF2975 domain-containing protein [Roseibium sp. MMSF_3544]